MVVRDLDFSRILAGPSEANAPLVVDANTVLTFPVAGERLQTVSRDGSDIREGCGCMDLIELPLRDRSDALKSPAELTTENLLSFVVVKRPNHNTIVLSSDVKRDACWLPARVNVAGELVHRNARIRAAMCERARLSKTTSTCCVCPRLSRMPRLGMPSRKRSAAAVTGVRSDRGHSAPGAVSAGGCQFVPELVGDRARPSYGLPGPAKCAGARLRVCGRVV